VRRTATHVLGSFDAKQRAPPIKGQPPLPRGPSRSQFPVRAAVAPWPSSPAPSRATPLSPKLVAPPCYRTHAPHGPSKQPAPPIRRSQSPGGRRPAAPWRPTAGVITAPANLPNQAWGTTRPSPARARPVPAAGSPEFGRTPCRPVLGDYIACHQFLAGSKLQTEGIFVRNQKF
jgi:hypothetical protein